MPFNRFEKITLTVAGITAFSMGSLILIAPATFYAGYGIGLDLSASMLSELRAFASGLAVLGALMLAGLWRSDFSRVSVFAALTVFLAFPLGRLVGVLADGAPSPAILGALAIEATIGALCLAAFRRRLRATLSGQDSRRVTA